MGCKGSKDKDGGSGGDSDEIKYEMKEIGIGAFDDVKITSNFLI